MDSYLFQELILFDASRPAVPFGKQLLVAMLSVILNNILFNFVYNLIPASTTNENIPAEYSTIQSKAVTPFVFGVSEIINGGIYAPIVEELFFRFLLFKLIFIKFLKMNVTTANILQSIVFGMMHMTNVITSSQSFNRTLLQTISASIGGFISAWSYIYTNSILTPVMAHMINNVIATSTEVIDYTTFYARASR